MSSLYSNRILRAGDNACPLVSVVIPTFNGSCWIEETLSSVFAQSYRSVEVVLIDDGSTDGTSEIAKSLYPEINVISGRRSGIGSARNIGLAHARGEYVAFLDHDDLWLPHKLQCQMELATRDSQLVVVYSDAEEFGARGTIHSSFFSHFSSLRDETNIIDALLNFAVPLMSTVLIKKCFLDNKNITFNPDASGVDDVGLLLDIAAAGGRFAAVQEPLVRRRLHETNLSQNDLNRFSKRIVVYRDLVHRWADRPELRGRLEMALRDAYFRTAECYWAVFDMKSARAHFKRSISLDARGVRALAYCLLSLLPKKMLNQMRHLRRLRAPSRESVT